MCGSGGGGEKGQVRYNNNNNNTDRGAAIRLFDRLFATVIDTSVRKKNLLDVDRFFSFISLTTRTFYPSR